MAATTTNYGLPSTTSSASQTPDAARIMDTIAIRTISESHYVPIDVTRMTP